MGKLSHWHSVQQSLLSTVRWYRGVLVYQGDSMRSCKCGLPLVERNLALCLCVHNENVSSRLWITRLLSPVLAGQWPFKVNVGICFGLVAEEPSLSKESPAC